jgi:hypothetical protein
LRGIVHFNRREFFEAHEVWEAIWMESRRDRADFFKGLIQAAVAILHFSNGNLSGARKLYEGQKRLLIAYAPRFLGLDVQGLLAKLDDLFAPVRAAAPGTHVPIDESKIPTLRIEPGG